MPRSSASSALFLASLCAVLTEGLVPLPVSSAEALRPPTLDDLLAVKTVTSVAISPDGRFVAYGVREADVKADAYVTRLWLAPTAGGTPFPLTASGKGASTFRWSPDGRSLAFLSGREEDKDQIFLIAAEGGEAVRLTKSETAVTDFAWSADAKQIAFLADEPETQALKDRKEKYGDYAVVRREYAFRHVFTLEVAEALKAPVTGRQRTHGRLWSVQDPPAWSPDGTAIAFAAAATPELAQGATADVFVLRLADDSVTRLVSQAGPDTSPVWSPDGRRIAFSTQMGRTRFYATNQQIAVVDASGGAPRLLAAAFDEDAELLDWLPDGIYFSGFQETAYHLFRLDPESGAFRRVSAPDGLLAGGFSLTTDARRVAFTAGSPSTMSEVFVSGTQPFAPTRLTDLSAQLAGLELGTREVVSWKSRDGALIEGVLIKPAGFDPAKKHPLLCVIHGGPTGIDRPVVSDFRYYPSDMWAARGALVLKVNYRGSAGYGERFRTLNYGNLGLGDAWDVLSGIDSLVARGFVDPGRLGCMGWSQGGYISAFLTTSTDRFKAISVGAGISNWATYYYNTDITPFTVQYLAADPAQDPEVYRKTSPMTYVKQARTPTLIQHGENDRRVPIPNAYELREGLEDRGVPVEMVVYKGFGHGITKPKAMRAVMQHNLAWFGHYIWNDPGPDLEAPKAKTARAANPDRAAVLAAYDAADAARVLQDWATLLEECRKLVSLAPQSVRTRYMLASALSLNGDKAEALKVLDGIAALGVRFDLRGDPDFASLQGMPEFASIVERMQDLTKPIGRSAPAFTLPQKDLLAEGVAHDAKTGAFFVSSVHRRKIVKVDPDGRATDFVKEGDYGLFSATALVADSERRALYVSSAATGQMTSSRKEDAGQSSLLEFDLDTGRLRRRVPPPEGDAHVSDLALAKDGTLYVADPQTGRICVLRPGSNRLETLVDAGPITSAQGMAVSVDGKGLFVADYLKGIAWVDLATGGVRFLETPPAVPLTGIDGLVLAGDSLVGIQNGLEPHRVLRLRLDPATTRIVESTILERANAAFDEPTLGVLVGRDFYYVANSQYGAYGEDGRPDEARLKGTVILKLRLDWLGGA
jgi:dipeptidyl aminopeptidase/acylaminoacyl peptidase